MKLVSGRDFARMVERRGWTLLRISGSHHIYGKTGSTVRLSIPKMPAKKRVLGSDLKKVDRHLIQPHE